MASDLTGTFCVTGTLVGTGVEGGVGTVLVLGPAAQEVEAPRRGRLDTGMDLDDVARDGAALAGRRTSGWRAPVTVAAALSVILGACSFSASDASHAGQVDYACALADHVAEDLELEDWSPLDVANHAAVREIGALTSLVGGTVRPVLEHEELSDAGRDLFAGLQRADGDLMQQGLDDVREQCTDLASSSKVDVTDEGQLEYACALMDHVLEEHGEVEAWARDDYAWHEVVGVASLAGVVSGVEASGPADLVEPASNVFAGVVRLDEEAMRAGVDGIDRWCQER